MTKEEAKEFEEMRKEIEEMRKEMEKMSEFLKRINHQNAMIISKLNGSHF